MAADLLLKYCVIFLFTFFLCVRIVRAHLEKEKEKKTNLQLFVLDDVCGGCKQMFFSLFLLIMKQKQKIHPLLFPQACAAMPHSVRNLVNDCGYNPVPGCGC